MNKLFYSEQPHAPPFCFDDGKALPDAVNWGERGGHPPSSTSATGSEHETSRETCSTTCACTRCQKKKKMFPLFHQSGAASKRRQERKMRKCGFHPSSMGAESLSRHELRRKRVRCFLQGRNTTAIESTELFTATEERMLAVESPPGENNRTSYNRRSNLGLHRGTGTSTVLSLFTSEPL